MKKIRDLIRAHREGPCPSPVELARLYRERLMHQIPYDHVLCCENCLDVVNDILGLPRVEERTPFDTISRQSAAHHSNPDSEKKRQGDSEPPVDEVERGPSENEPTEEEEPVEQAPFSFERVKQAMAEAYEARPNQLLVCINGRPCASLSAEQARQTSTLWPHEDVEFIEVLSDAGVRLAYMDVDERQLATGPQHGRAALSRDREIELSISLDETGHASVQVNYHDPSPVREHNWRAWLARLFGSRRELEAAWRVPALAMVTVVLFLVGTAVLIASLIQTRNELATLTREREQMRQQVAQLTENLEKLRPSAQPPSPSASGLPPSQAMTPDRTAPEPSEIARLEPTRGQKRRQAGASLSEVKRIYVPSLGDSPFSQQLREHLITELQASGRFTVTENPDEAEAALKGSVRRETSQVDRATGQTVEIGSATLELVNASGRVLWSTASGRSRGRYRGLALAIADEVIEELLQRSRQ
jgi:hypothetical protein